jgi:hypothetical protein
MKPTLARLTPRVAMLAPRLGTQAQQGKPWQKNELSAARQLSGQQRKKRNDRIKLRDRYTCQACGKLRMPKDLEIDHRVPISEGGSDTDQNLQSLCAGEGQCHDLKSRAERSRISGSQRRW